MIELRLLHFSKALSPIVFTLGILTEIKLVQPENAKLFINEIESGISIDDKPEQFANTFSSREESKGEKVIDFNAMQLKKVYGAMESTVEGITIDRIFLHPENAERPIEVIL